MTAITVTDIERHFFASTRTAAKRGYVHLRLSGRPSDRWTDAFAELVVRHARDLLAGGQVAMTQDSEGAYLVVSFDSYRDATRLIQAVDGIVGEASVGAARSLPNVARRALPLALAFLALVVLPVTLLEGAFASPAMWIVGCVTVATTSVAAGFTGLSAFRREAALLIIASVLSVAATPGMTTLWG